MKSPFAVLFSFGCLVAPAWAQTFDTLNLAAVGTDRHWKIVGRTASMADIKGKHALKLSEDSGMGVVWLDTCDFANGSIEVDILGRSEPVQGSFVGIALRVVDGRTHDAVYFRPFNFRATDSTRHAHALQYVSDPEWTWQRLRTERPGQYEKPIVPEPDGDEWFHVRIDVQRPRIQVFVNGGATPSLVVDELSARTHGPIGLWVGEGSGGYFANLRVQKRTP